MKLRNLARSSSNPTSFLPALHIFLSRFGSRGTARRSRKSYEFVLTSFSNLRFLTLLQQATVVTVLRILYRPRRPGSPATFPIRTHHEDRNFRPRACHGFASVYLLIFEQNQHGSYREVLVAGDLSQKDLGRAGDQVVFQVSRLQTDFDLPVLTTYQGYFPYMAHVPVWRKRV